MIKAAFKNKYKSTFKLSLVCTALAMSNVTVANEQNDNALEWPYAKGFYIGGQIGSANTDIEKESLFSHYNNAGLDPNLTDVDKTDTSYSLFVGYRFNEFWSIEAGYQDLGDRSVSFMGSTSNTAAYYDLADKVYPETADGMSLNVLGSLPFDNGVTLTGKIGYYDWEMDAVSTDLSGNSMQRPGASSKSDSGVMYGVELGYHFDYDLQGYISYQFIPLDEDDVNVASIGFRYWFEDKPTYKSPKPVKPVPVVAEVKPEPAPLVVKPIDTDKDGVYDDKDLCPSSPSDHLVDSAGCTQYVMKPVDMKVVVLYPVNSSEIPKKYYDELADLATFIKKYDVESLNVVGHTSASGPSKYNQWLSERRAESVAKFLTKRFGIEESILKPVGKGETQPVSDDPDLNRRIEVYIKSDVKMPVLKTD